MLRLASKACFRLAAMPTRTMIAAPSVSALSLSVRSFSAAIAPDSVTRAGKGGKKVKRATDLASVLDHELSHEKKELKEFNISPEALVDMASSMSDFKVADIVGVARFHLTKTAGSQQIRLDLDCNPIPAEDDEYFDENAEGEGAAAGEEDEEREEKVGYRMVATITDSAKARTVQVQAFISSGMTVQHVAHYKAGIAPTAEDIFAGNDISPKGVYSGPSFDVLDEELQKAVYEYLADRGIDDELSAKLSDYCDCKERIEYANWLENMKTFAS